jgi:hypothetical protein
MFAASQLLPFNCAIFQIDAAPDSLEIREQALITASVNMNSIE